MVVRLGRRLAPAKPSSNRPDWLQADANFIDRALSRALEQSGGGWVVLDASRNIVNRPRKFRVAGDDWVAWRTGTGAAEVVVAPNGCPHMGAELHLGRCERDQLICPWHGLALRGPRGDWRPVPTFDDGVLVWAQLLDEAPTAEPVIVDRPSLALDGVVSRVAACEPQDILANRLDPWHGVHYHPHSFAELTTLSSDETRIKLRVAYRVSGPLVVEVDCTFHCPTRRSIVMTIVDGDGAGSVVETHATPIEDGRTMMVEAVLATSSRPGFALAHRFRKLIRPLMERRAGRLWEEDVAYAERRYALRATEKS